MFCNDEEHNNKGKLFKCCSKKYEFWKWVIKGETSSESSSIGSFSTNHSATRLENNVACLFETICRLTHEKDVEITVTIRKGNTNAECDKKGKGPAWFVVVCLWILLWHFSFVNFFSYLNVVVVQCWWT